MPVTANFLFNTLCQTQNGRYFSDDVFKCILLNENVWINNISAIVQITAWRRPGDKPLFQSMMFSSLTHICVTLPEWVNEVDDKKRERTTPIYVTQELGHANSPCIITWIIDDTRRSLISKLVWQMPYPHNQMYYHSPRERYTKVYKLASHMTATCKCWIYQFS